MYIYIIYIIMYIYIYIIHGFNGDSMMIWPPEILTKNGPSLPWIECDQARDVGLCIASSTTRWIFTWDWSHSLWFSVASAALILHCTRDMPNQRVGAEWHQSEQHRPRKIPGSADIFDTRHATRCSMDIGWRAHLQRVSCFSVRPWILQLGKVYCSHGFCGSLKWCFDQPPFRSMSEWKPTAPTKCFVTLPSILTWFSRYWYLDSMLKAHDVWCLSAPITCKVHL